MAFAGKQAALAFNRSKVGPRTPLMHSSISFDSIRDDDLRCTRWYLADVDMKLLGQEDPCEYAPSRMLRSFCLCLGVYTCQLLHLDEYLEIGSRRDQHGSEYSIVMDEPGGGSRCCWFNLKVCDIKTLLHTVRQPTTCRCRSQNHPNRTLGGTTSRLRPMAVTDVAVAQTALSSAFCRR